jgi:hypothetical protein
MKRAIQIRINPTDSEIDLNSSHKFWSYFHKKDELERGNPSRLEHLFKRNFINILKERLVSKFGQEQKALERLYHENSLFKKFYYDFNRTIEEKYNYYDLQSLELKFQELKNEFFKDNQIFKEILSREVLASQIEFGISNISYSSLGFDLFVEPLDKVVKLFDNNFEYFKVFLNQYIPNSFIHSIQLHNYDIPLDVSIIYPSELSDAFMSKKTSNNETIGSNNSITQPKFNKGDKADYLWILTNFSLVVPVILALVILIVTVNKIDTIFKIRQDNFIEVQKENDVIFKNYKELIELQKETYNELLVNPKKDSIK